MKTTNGRPVLGEAFRTYDSSHPDNVAHPPERGDGRPDTLELVDTDHGIGEVRLPGHNPALFSEVRTEGKARRELVRAALKHGFAVYDNYSNGMGATATVTRAREYAPADVVIVWTYGRVETLRQAQQIGPVVVAITTGGMLSEV
jgi:hypothetical protein